MQDPAVRRLVSAALDAYRLPIMVSQRQLQEHAHACVAAIRQGADPEQAIAAYLAPFYAVQQEAIVGHVLHVWRGDSA